MKCNLNNICFNDKPFPHLIIDDFLGHEDYHDILDYLEEIDFFPDDLSNDKINRSTFMIYHKGKYYLKDDVMKRYMSIFMDPEFQRKMIDMMKPSRSNELPQDLWFQADCYRGSFKFPIHCDSGDKYLTFVYYTPLFDDMDKKLGTRVYNGKKELEGIVEYKPNRMIVFAPSDRSWHNMEGTTDCERNSLQGWFLCTKKRRKGPAIRRGFNSS
jgi:hypothetical protein